MTVPAATVSLMSSPGTNTPSEVVDLEPPFMSSLFTSSPSADVPRSVLPYDMTDFEDPWSLDPLHPFFDTDPNVASEEEEEEDDAD